VSPANRLFSLSGVVPLGAFFVVHVVANARALRGDAAFLAAARAFERAPGLALALVEALFVFAPLAFHGAMGAWMVATRRRREPPVPYPEPVRVSMRVTGVVALAFLAMHLPEIRFRHGVAGVRPSGAEALTVLVSDLSSTLHGVPWRAVVYLTAAGCVAFHFAAGLWGYFVTSRAEVGKGAETARNTNLATAAAWVAAAVGVVLWVLLADVVVYHATGACLIGGGGSEAADTGEPCPAPARP
jgi:succinate dehydrogenase / fumarate reductase cytochrome b subunit